MIPSDLRQDAVDAQAEKERTEGVTLSHPRGAEADERSIAQSKGSLLPIRPVEKGQQLGTVGFDGLVDRQSSQRVKGVLEVQGDKTPWVVVVVIESHPSSCAFPQEARVQAGRVHRDLGPARDTHPEVMWSENLPHILREFLGHYLTQESEPNITDGDRADRAIGFAEGDQAGEGPQ